MSKTAEEILSVLPKFFVEMLPGNMETCVLSEQALQAMQTYAEQQSVEFGEFLLADYDEVTDPQDSGNSLWQLKGTKQQYTTPQLFKIWKDETGNNKG